MFAHFLSGAAHDGLILQKMGGEYLKAAAVPELNHNIVPGNILLILDQDGY